MADFDIRTGMMEATINRIVIDAESRSEYNVCNLNKYGNRWCISHNDNETELVITNEEHAKNIIKAIEKAIEIGF